MIEFQRLSYAPVTRIFANATRYDDQQLIEDLAKIVREMQRDRAAGVRCVSVIDLRDALPLNAKHRKLVMEWLRESEPMIPFISLGTVFHAPSPLVRGVLTAMFWLHPYPVPHTVVADMDDAMRWAIVRMEDSGTPVPARLRQELGRAFAFQGTLASPSLSRPQ
jgi:hypothetical protein